jgi:hypothetical protein
LRPGAAGGESEQRSQCDLHHNSPFGLPNRGVSLREGLREKNQKSPLPDP